MTRTPVYETRDNIFADLGRPDADAHYLKAQIVAELFRLTTDRKLTQTKAGDLMGITQPEVSRLFKGHFREYSVERLITFLTAFDQDVEIVSRPRTSTSLRRPVSFKPGRARPAAARRA
ncbi:MAG: helix-turn-helix transcriptional regulator [Hyphomicrobium sp.]